MRIGNTCLPVSNGAGATASSVVCGAGTRLVGNQCVPNKGAGGPYEQAGAAGDAAGGAVDAGGVAGADAGDGGLAE